MHIRKAYDELWKLASAPANLGTFTTAYVLLDGLDKDNEDIDGGERLNNTASEKIQSARGGFEVLCGIGEGDADQWPEGGVRGFIQQALYGVKEQISDEGDSPCPHFKRWPPVVGITVHNVGLKTSDSSAEALRRRLRTSAEGGTLGAKTTTQGESVAGHQGVEGT